MSNIIIKTTTAAFIVLFTLSCTQNQKEMTPVQELSNPLKFGDMKWPLESKTHLFKLRTHIL